MFKITFSVIFAILGLAFCAFAAGEGSGVDDDASPDDDSSPSLDDDSSDIFGVQATAGGKFPIILKASTQYDFAFQVFNSKGGAIAIKKVDITLPNTCYTLDKANLKAPQALHSQLGSWSVEFVDASATITWEFNGMISSAAVGDIREREMLTFEFVATTDKDATDGFAWRLTGDDAAAMYSAEMFYFSGSQGSPEDDDYSPGPCRCASHITSSGCGC